MTTSNWNRNLNHMSYRIHELIPGHAVHPKYKGKMLVGVPERLVKDIGCNVLHNDAQMMIHKSEKPLEIRTFPDKFPKPGRPSTYKLYYYEWKPRVVQKSFLRKA